MNRIFILLSILAVSCLSGCANTKSFSHLDSQRIDSVSIDPKDIKYKYDKEIIWLNTSAKAWASLGGGLIGAAIYESFDDHSPEGAILNILSADDLLKNTVSESFRYQFKNGGPFEVTTMDKASAYLEIEVASIQFHELNGDNLKLTGLYWARLYDSATGALLWSNYDQYIAFNSDLIEFTLEEYTSEPAKLRYALSVLSQMLAGDFVEDLNGQRFPVNHDLHSVASYHAAKSQNEQIVDALPKSTKYNSLPAPPSSGDNAEIKLTQLKELYSKGLITEDEYKMERGEVLGEL